MKILSLPFCDFHTHMRSPAEYGDWLFERLVALNTEHYLYVVVEPNTFLDAREPGHHIETANDVARYRRLIRNVMPRHYHCQSLMLIKLTPRTTETVVSDAKSEGAVGLKLYPEGVTTGSEHGGVSDFCGPEIMKVLSRAEKKGMILQIHAELPGAFSMERERRFHPVIRKYAQRFPGLRIIVEHISDRGTLELLSEFENVYGSITGHHLHHTLDDVLGRVDNHCRPNPKTPEDRAALRQAICKNDESGKLISITDSAGHPWPRKHLVMCACAGVFNPAEIAIPHLVETIEDLLGTEDLLKTERNKRLVQSLRAFAFENGCRAYRLKVSEMPPEVALIKSSWVVPEAYGKHLDRITPFRAGETLRWKITSV